MRSTARLPPTPPTLDPCLGRVLADRWRLDRRLGEGSYGCVYAALDLRDRETVVAVKAVLRTRSDFAEASARLGREALILERFRCAAMPAFIAYGDAGDLSYLVMERIEGEDLGALVSVSERAGWRGRELLSLLSACAMAVASLHDAGVAHLDLKPSNLMLRPDGRCVLVDFGGSALLAPERIWTLPPGADVRFAATGRQHVMGTPGYMAPERFVESRPPVDLRLADVYALGAVFHLLVTGRPAVPGEGTAAALWALQNDVTLPVSEVPPLGLPLDARRRLADAIEGAMRRHPEERTASARGLVDALAWVGALSTPSPTVTLPREEVLPARPLGRLEARMPFVLLLAGAVATAVTATFVSQSRAAAEQPPRMVVSTSVPVPLSTGSASVAPSVSPSVPASSTVITPQVAPLHSAMAAPASTAAPVSAAVRARSPVAVRQTPRPWLPFTDAPFPALPDPEEPRP
ncbi:serine/threonine protein kinase [Myxococcota bacterium]|nr:serine/threonine protein kinase [Myxococcota bacterium]